MKCLIRPILLFTVACFILSACEGPMGPAGKDANESCTLCHNNDVVQAKAIEYEHSLHFTGKAFEEGTRNSCAPCHSHQGFLNVVKNNTPATFIADPDNAGKFLNNYVAETSALALPGAISCFTCHSSLHSTYTDTDFMPLTTVNTVPMTMYGGSKIINFTNTSASLCSKCHQPRPVTASSGNVIDYSLLISAPTTTYSLSSLSYRTGIHYGAHGAMAAGVGGIEFGTGYSNSAHVNGASCTTCHMAKPSGLAGGHSFNAAGNYTGCNTTGCHTTMSASNAALTAAKADITAKLGQLATKLNALGTGGHDIIQKDAASGLYTGYLDIYDASSNSTGYYKNPGQGNVSFPAITNAQFGAIINYQLVLRDASNGVHNYSYIKKLLENSLAAW